MSDWLSVALRFAVYGNLLLLFGLAVYPLYGVAIPRIAERRSVIAALALLGLVLSGVALLQMVAAMAGTSILAPDGETLSVLLGETPAGMAFNVRSIALAGVMAAALAGKSVRALMVPAGAAVALASLAWTGHAAATEGTAGLVHRSADIVHLLAAGAWIGALAVLVALVCAPLGDDADLAAAEGALTAFAGAGSVIVALILVSGLINVAMIVGMERLATLPATLYGQLLIAKLVLFAAMLGHAAVNRWRLTPSLERARAAGDPAMAARALRISVVSELVAAAGIIALVAWLGTLDPAGVQ